MLVALHTELPVARAYLETVIETAGEALPETRALLAEVDASSSLDAITGATGAALAEVSGLRRGSTSSRLSARLADPPHPAA